MRWEPEYEDTSDCPRDKHVLAWLSQLTRYDHHVLSWKALRAVRTRPRPPVGHPPPDTSPLETVPEPETSAWPPWEPLDSPWLDNLSRFGPEATDSNQSARDFSAIDPATPPWLDELHKRWVDPPEFLDL